MVECLGGGRGLLQYSTSRYSRASPSIAGVLQCAILRPLRWGLLATRPPGDQTRYRLLRILSATIIDGLMVNNAKLPGLSGNEPKQGMIV